MSRNITEAEIKKILTYIPLAQSVSSEQQRIINEQQCDVVASILRTMLIHPDGIELLGEELKKAWNRSVVDPGTSVGMLAAQGIAQPATQGKLKNFSHSGTIRSRSYDADRLIEILEVSATQRYRNMTIVFENQYITYEEVLKNFRPKLVGITLRQLVLNFETLNRFEQEYDNSWWDNYCYIFGVDPNQHAPMFLRLHLDIITMAKYKISMKMIHNALTTGDNMEFISVIYSPFDFGILDILVLPNAEITIKVSGKKEKIRVNDEMVFLENVIIPSIVATKLPEGDIQISGVKGIVDMLPVELPLHSLFVSSHDRGRNIYDIYINKRLESTYGITRQRLKDVLKEVGARIVKIPDSELIYKEALPLYIRCYCDSDPITKLNDLYKSLKFEEDGVNYRDWFNPTYHRLVYCYGETEGNNLMDVLSIPGIDKNHTISNDLREVRDVLGINAANNLIVQEMMIVCETIGFVHQNHIITIAGAMTRNGIILPVNYQGTSKNAGTFTNISFERPMESIISSSIGTNEYVASSSTLHGTGRIVSSGTGAIDVFLDEGNEFISLKPIPIEHTTKPQVIQLSTIGGIKRPVKRPVDRDICVPTIDIVLVYTFSSNDVPVPINYQSIDSNVFAQVANDIGLYTMVTLY